jgi:phosphate transport system substrate-binding protein
MRRTLLALTSLLAIMVSPSAGAQTLINGAGATFPYPLYSKWFSDYTTVDPTVRFNYQSIGSGAGIRQISDRTVDFGASDTPLTDEQLAKAPGLIHVPTVLGAVAITYNLPSVPSLNLTPEVLAGIYLGQITSWDDAKLAAINPNANLPKLAIGVVHRSDGSGTSAVFTDYLTKVSPAWAKDVRSGTAVHWPTGIGAKGNEGVTGQIKQLPGSLGYVELVYATQNNLPLTALKNKAGAFVRPDIDSIVAAAAGASTNLPEDLRVSITDPPGEKSYPIASFTYILAYKEQADPVKGTALANFLWWATHAGQATAPGLHYAPLPPPVVKRVEQKIKMIQVAGKLALTKQ